MTTEDDLHSLQNLDFKPYVHLALLVSDPDSVPVIIKTFGGKKHEIPVSLSETVGQFKRKISHIEGISMAEVYRKEEEKRKKKKKRKKKG